MDILSVAGIILAFAALIVGAILKGAGVSSLLGSAAFVIVILGTIASILLQTPKATMQRALKIVSWIFKPPLADGHALIVQIVDWANVARKQGLLGLEPQVEMQTDPFLKKGLQM